MFSHSFHSNEEASGISEMYFYSLYFFLFIPVSYSQNPEFIRDYFTFKGVSHVVGFSCEGNENLHKVSRTLSDSGISISWVKDGMKFNFTKLLVLHYSILGVFADSTCGNETIKGIFHESSNLKVYDHLHTWLVLAKKLSHTVEFLNDTTFSIATDLAIAVPENDAYYLYDIYNHCKRCGDNIHIEELGKWQRESGLEINLKDNKLLRRSNYHGLPIKAAIFFLRRPKDDPIESYILKLKHGPDYDNYGRYGYSLVAPVAEMYNITLDIEEITKWDDNDTVGPMMWKMYNETIDINLIPSIPTRERYRCGKPLVPTRPIRTCFVFRTIPATTVDMCSITNPFSITAWYSIAGVAIITIFTLCLIFNAEYNDGTPDYTISLLIFIGALCQQGIPVRAKQTASHIAFLQILIFGYLAYGYYSAAVVSGRLNIPLNKMNDSLFSLVKSDLILSSRTYVFFNLLLDERFADIAYFKKRWLKVPPNERFTSVDVGLRRIAQGGHAYHIDPTEIYPSLERDFTMEMICQLTEVCLLRTTDLSIFSSHNTPVSEIIRIGLLKTISAGVRQRMLSKWVARKPFCDPNKRFVSSLTIYEVIPMFIVLFCGTLCAVIICVVENIIYYLHKKPEIRFGGKER